MDTVWVRRYYNGQPCGRPLDVSLFAHPSMQVPHVSALLDRVKNRFTSLSNVHAEYLMLYAGEKALKENEAAEGDTDPKTLLEQGWGRYTSPLCVDDTTPASSSVYPVVAKEILRLLGLPGPIAESVAQRISDQDWLSYLTTTMRYMPSLPSTQTTQDACDDHTQYEHER